MSIFLWTLAISVCIILLVLGLDKYQGIGSP